MKRIIYPAAVTALLLCTIIAFIAYFNRAVASFDNEFEVKAHETKKINFIHWGDFPKEIFNKFSEKHPDINVVFENFDEDYYPTVQKMRIASGAGVDIMGVMESDYEDFVRRGYLVDISDRKFLYNYKGDVREAVQRYVGNGKEYAIAYRSWVFGIWYNKILFNKYNLKVPENYTEFLEVCASLKANGVSPLVLGARDDWASSYIYFLRIFNLIGNDKAWFKNLKTGDSKWSDPEVESAFRDIADFLENGYLSKDSINLTYHQAFSEFTKGHAAMIIMGDWSLNLIKGDTEKVCDPGVFPIPYNSSGTTEKVGGSRAGFLTGIFSDSKNVEEAELLIEYLSTPEAAQIYSDITMSVPTVKRVDISRLKFNTLWEPLRAKELISPGLTEMDSEIRKKLNMSTKELIIGAKTYEQILEELQALQDELSKSE